MTVLMTMDEMAMTFFTSSSTPLFSSAWSPNSTGQYAGTCIFLIAFTTVFRALLAVRVNFFQLQAMLEHRRTRGLIYPNLADEKRTPRPWRAKEALLVASMDTVLAGVGYLLMVVVMTMNVGYFLSILAGVYLGSLAVARFMAESVLH